MRSDSKDGLVLVEQIKMLVKQAPPMISLTMVTTIIIVIALFGYVENWVPLFLITAMMSLNALRFWHYSILKYGKITVENVNFHKSVFVVFSFLGGGIWGMLGLLPPMLPDPFLLVLTATLICGLVAGSLSYLSIYNRAFFAFSISCISPFAIRCILSGQDIFITIGLLMSLFLVVNLVTSHMAQKNVLMSINLVQENKELIAKLKNEKIDAVEARDIADHDNEAKSRLLAEASHDLRQPLHAMGFFVEALQHEKNPSKIKALTKKVSQTSEALRNLLGSLLDISKIEAGVMKPCRTHFNVNEVLMEVIQEFTELAQEKGLDISYNPCVNIVHSDKEMLGRIIRNLVSNAVHYTKIGYVNITCVVGNGFVIIYVSDSGIGIPKGYKEDVFKDFFQIADGQINPSHGLGLGLSIVDGLCQLLDHEIRLESEIGMGSVFSIKVPQGNLEEVVLEIPDLNILPGDVIANTIVLSAETASLESISGIMRHWGHVVADFKTCAEVMEFIVSEEFIPDLVISDIKLQDASGIEAIGAIQMKISKKIPGIIMTGSGSGIATNEVLANGFSVLQKPVQPAKLRSMVSYLVQEI